MKVATLKFQNLSHISEDVMQYVLTGQWTYRISSPTDGQGFFKAARRRRKIRERKIPYSIVVDALFMGHRDDMDVNSTSGCLLTQPKPPNISYDAHPPRESHAAFEVPQISQ